MISLVKITDSGFKTFIFDDREDLLNYVNAVLEKTLKEMFVTIERKGDTWTIRQNEDMLFKFKVASIDDMRTVDNIVVETDDGVLIAESMSDPDYPGIVVSYLPDGKTEFDCALVDVHEGVIKSRLYDATLQMEDPVSTVERNREDFEELFSKEVL